MATGDGKPGGRARVAILMGSKSDADLMRGASDALESLGVVCDVRVISAHRTPERHHKYVAPPLRTLPPSPPPSPTSTVAS